MIQKEETKGLAQQEVSKKLVYIAHPISGDISGNIDKVLKICREIHTNSNNIIPSAPYITVLQYLDDNIQEERRLGFEANKMMFERGGFDEIWLCGEKISSGMKEEVEWCVALNIPIVCYNPALVEEYIHFRKTGKWFKEDK